MYHRNINHKAAIEHPQKVNKQLTVPPFQLSSLKEVPDIFSLITAKVGTEPNNQRHRGAKLYTTLRKLSLTYGTAATDLPDSNGLQKTKLSTPDLVIEAPTGTPSESEPSLPRGRFYPNLQQQIRKLPCPLSSCKWSFDLPSALLKHLKYPHRGCPEAKEFIEALEAEIQEKEAVKGIKQRELERLKSIEQRQSLTPAPIRRERPGRLACRMGLYCPKLSFKNERGRLQHEKRCTYRYTPN